MASFITRVELHDAKTWQDYDTLHKAMAGEGFSQTIKGSDGLQYQLPTAEYERTAYETQAQILVRAQRAAARTGKRYSILVTESNGCTWIGLEPVKQYASR